MFAKTCWWVNQIAGNRLVIQGLEPTWPENALSVEVAAFFLDSSCHASWLTVGRSSGEYPASTVRI